ncbi:hypothetical protein VTK26DRAFT_1469 [Humicola hyalothermophila]
MKSFVPVLALAAGATATFRGAPPFTCPANTDNKCTDKQTPGFSWLDLDFGDFFEYNDFFFNGWKCEEDGPRGRFGPRTGRKAIGGICTSDKSKSPSFGCGPKIDKFSLGSIHVKPEFDCDLEFHYDMPDGSKCKHRSPCKKTGTTIVNRQCGGAKNVTIIYPPQPNKPKPTCSIRVPTISFDCDTASSTKPPKTTQQPPETTEPAETTAAEPTTTPSSDVPAEPSSAPPAVTSDNTVPAVTDTTSAPAGGSSSVPPAESTVSSVAPGDDDSTSVEVPPETSTPVTKTIVTSFDSTSTIFTTSTQTITQCEPTVPSCPENSVVTTVVTIAISTTICPVTETLTSVESNTVPGTVGPTAPPADSPSAPADSTAVASSVKPIETLPAGCPSVVPSCLNTFLFLVGCIDNTDASCYCPDAAFVKNVYECFYAHGESDEVIAEAVAYFQGICGKYVGQNPGIATDATVTSHITVTAAPTAVVPAPVYTTIVVDVTTVVPCTDDAGEPIPSSSSTVTVSTSMTVPQVDFTTDLAGGVEVVPITTPAPAPAPTDDGSDGGDVVTQPGSDGNTDVVDVPTGTGSLVPTPSSPIVIGAGGRVGASFGLAAAAALAAVAAL